MIEKIEKVLDLDIRPYLKEHYGDVKLINFKNGIVQIELLGQCHGCPSAKFTVENVIEGKLKEKISEVKKVDVISMVSDELLDMAKKVLNGNVSLQ